MTQPAHRRSGGLLERALPWSGPLSAEFDEIFERMHRLLESAPSGWRDTSPWAPPAELCETDSAYVIECELPGFKREDIDIEVGEHELTISGETAAQEREGVVRRTTRRSGRFEHRVMMPAAAKPDEAKAVLADGVLTVTVPKAETVRQRRIEIEV